MMTAKKTKNIPTREQTDLFFKCRRRCALCFVYDDDKGQKEGQINHINKDETNHKSSNLIWLCINHHSAYHTRGRIAKGYTQHELKSWKDLLEEYFENSFYMGGGAKMKKTKISKKETELKYTSKKHPVITPEIYNLRIPIFHAYRQLVSKLMHEAKLDMDDLRKFAKETSDAFFIYDEKIADYLSLVYGKAFRFQMVQQLGKSPKDNTELQKFLDEEGEIVNWFMENFDEARKLFKQYLNLG